MRSFSHWTPRYVSDRLQSIISNRLHPDWPWLTPAAVRFLNLWLSPADAVFEWGSGRSTLWIAQRVHHVTSVESNQNWFLRVKSIAEQKGLRNIDLKLFSEANGSGNIANYVSHIAAPAGPFDMVVVDGLYRDHCALAAIDRLKPAGLLLIDNINWYLPSRSASPCSRRDQAGPESPLWADFMDRARDWRRIWTSNGVTDTAIWVKTP